MEIYDATFRMYDAQIGRFHQIDPLTDIFENQSPYSFAYNNPLSFNDPLGLAADTAWKTLPEVVVVGHKPKGSPSAGFIDFNGGKKLPGSDQALQQFPIGVEIWKKAPQEKITEAIVGEEVGFNPWLLRGLGTAVLTVTPLTAGSGSDRQPYDQFQKIYTRVPSPVQEPEGIQYTLRAAADGFYPVYAWGSRGIAISGVWLSKGEIWKIGTTSQADPRNRYPAEFYLNTGRGLYMVQEFPPFGKAPMDQVLFVEKMKLINYVMGNDGNLPPGNTKFQ